jgi:ATP-dependent Clp protease ATP-binding subunit ClpB
MTSNVGSHLIQDKLQLLSEENRDELVASLRGQLVELLRQSMRPEFLNRIDEIILFKPLTMKEISKIVGLQLRAVQDLASQNSIGLEFTEDLTDWLAKIGYDPIFGARPLKRVIQKYVTNPLAERILDRSVNPGDTVKVGIDARGIVEIATLLQAEVAHEQDRR